MIAAIVLGFVMATPDRIPTEKLKKMPIPEVWSYVKDLRVERGRTIVRLGIEGETNEARRTTAEDVLIERLRYRPHKLGPGRWLMHIPEAGLYHLDVISIPED